MAADAYNLLSQGSQEFKKENGGVFANINKPTAGATHEAELPRSASYSALFTGHSGMG